VLEGRPVDDRGCVVRPDLILDGDDRSARAHSAAADDDHDRAATAPDHMAGT
jgi:hypothetical protein